MLKFTKIDFQKLPLSKLILVAVTIWAITATNSCHEIKIQADGEGVAINMLAAEKYKFQTEKNKLGQTVNTQKEIIVQNKEDAKLLQKQLLEASNLNKITRSAMVATATDIRNINALFDAVNSIPQPIFYTKTDTGFVKSEAVKVNTHFSDSTKWYAISGIVLADKIHFDSIYFANRITLNYGEKRGKGLFGYFKKTSVVEVVNSNPYTQTKEMQNITFPKKKINKAAWFVGGIATAIGGYYLLKQ